MSKLLISEPPLMVLPRLAAKIGLNEAIMLQQIHYWIGDPRCPNQREGCNWHYDSYEGWQKQFPFWSIMTIRRIAEKLRKLELVIAKNFNADKGDRTLWYTINYDEVEKLDVDSAPTHSANVAPHVFKMNTPSVQNEQTHMSKMNTCIYKEQRLHTEITTENDILRKEKKLSTKTGDKSVDKPNSDAKLSNIELTAMFDEIWQRYPLKKGRQKALEAFIKCFNSLSRDDAANLAKKFIDGLMAHISEHETKLELQKQGGDIWVPQLPYLATWINQRRWEDDYQTPEQLLSSTKKRNGVLDLDSIFM